MGKFSSHDRENSVDISFSALLDQPSLDIAHVSLQCANVSNSPLFGLLEMPGDDDKCALVSELCTKWRGFAGWGVRW